MCPRSTIACFLYAALTMLQPTQNTLPEHGLKHPAATNTASVFDTERKLLIGWGGNLYTDDLFSNYWS